MDATFVYKNRGHNEILFPKVMQTDSKLIGNINLLKQRNFVSEIGGIMYKMMFLKLVKTLAIIFPNLMETLVFLFQKILDTL